MVYRHFADREDLFGAVLDAIADDVLMPRILGALGEAAQASSEQLTLDADTVRRVVRAFIAVVDEEPQLYRFALARASSGLDGDFVASTERQIAQALSALLGDRLRELGRDSGGAEVWAFGVVGMVQLATQRWFDQRSMTADALADYLTVLATGGLSGVLTALIPLTPPLRHPSAPPSTRQSAHDPLLEANGPGAVASSRGGIRRGPGSGGAGSGSAAGCGS